VVSPSCGRYIHSSDEISQYVRRPSTTPPLPEWKEYAGFRDVIRDADRARIESGDI
jgi:hypothetical protein